MKRTATIIALFLTVVAAARFQEEQPWPTPEPTPYQWPTPEPTPEPTPDCDHESNSASRFEQVRLLPPVKIRNFDFRNIEYTHEDKHGIHVGSLNANRDTVMPENIWKAYKKQSYWILYCMKCKHIYTIVEVRPEQIQAAPTPKPVKRSP